MKACTTDLKTSLDYIVADATGMRHHRKTADTVIRPLDDNGEVLCFTERANTRILISQTAEQRHFKNIQCVKKKRDNNVLVISSTKLGRLWWNLVHRFLNKFAAKWSKRLFHLIWIMSLHYFVKLEMLIGQCYHWVVTKRNFRIYPTLTVAPNLSSWWSQLVMTIAREGVQNTHHWSGWTETATEHGVGQAGLCRHCEWRRW